MSTKTNFKRLSLVAISSLGFGLLSIVPAHADENPDKGLLSVSITNGNKGVITAADGTAIGAITTDGYVSLLLDGQNIANGDYTMAVVTGGTVVSLGLGAVAQGGTTWYRLGAESDDTELRFYPAKAGTNMVIKTYNDADADLVGESGEIKDTWTYNVLAPGLAGVYSAANSRFVLEDDDASSAYPSTDVLYANSVANGNQGRIAIKLYDGTATALSSNGSRVVTASVKSGDCLVGADGAQTLKFATITMTAAEGSAFTAQATDDAPTSCVVEIAVDGVVAATKTVTHQGAVASIAVSDVEVADSGATAQTGLAYVVAKDSAGNTLGGIVVAEGNGANGSVSSVTFSEARTASASSTVNRTTSGQAWGAAPASVPTSIGWTCSGVKGTADMTVKYTPSTNVAIHSNVFKAACYGDAVNYSASLDKASYVPGDIATLTITATDSSKNAANDQESIGTASTKEIAIAGSNMTAITAPTNADTLTGGKKTYKFIVGSSGGSYQLSVDLPKFNSTTYSQSAVTVPYKIAVSGTTNEDILKSIVSLIASINKQIQALQKLILKR